MPSLFLDSCAVLWPEMGFCPWGLLFFTSIQLPASFPVYMLRTEMLPLTNLAFPHSFHFQASECVFSIASLPQASCLTDLVGVQCRKPKAAAGHDGCPGLTCMEQVMQLQQQAAGGAFLSPTKPGCTRASSNETSVASGCQGGWLPGWQAQIAQTEVG